MLVLQDGVVFLDEIDKICNSSENRHGADASAEGVQRDLLPLIEGCVQPCVRAVQLIGCVWSAVPLAPSMAM